jgi:hypothetical protein
MRIKIELFRDVFIQRAVLGRMSRPRRLRTDLALYADSEAISVLTRTFASPPSAHSGEGEK